MDRVLKSIPSGARSSRAGSSAGVRGEEAALLDRVARRDRRAFETLYRIYHPRLTRFLMKMTRRPALVEEVLNDTMMVVWERPSGFNGTSKLSSWIFSIAYRQALAALRKQDVPVDDIGAAERESLEPAPDHAIWQQRQSQALLECLDGLSFEHRTVVDLTYFHDFGYREIAEVMDCPVDTMKSRMFYARRHLGRLVTGELADWL